MNIFVQVVRGYVGGATEKALRLKGWSPTRNDIRQSLEFGSYAS
jgi:hypothetical protein